VDLAARARVSATTIGRVERGRLDGIGLGTLRAVAEALGARFEPALRWQGPDLERLVDARHAALHEALARWLGALDGWVLEPEVSFSYFGERGVIDIVAWHPGRRSLLVIELKTEIVDVGRLLGSMDQRRRLGWRIARDRGWDPVTVSTWVVLAPSRTNHRSLAAYATVLRRKFPVDGRGLRRWLRDPIGRVDALSFLPERHLTPVRRPVAPTRRVTIRDERHA
jgi:transcriptional regulator with XRE-family HTH domain